MTTSELPQIYLITPPEIELAHFPDQLAGLLDAHPVACLRLALSSDDESHIARAADACRAVAHARDVALVITDHAMLAERLGLDGVHLSDGPRRVRALREDLGRDAIVGAFCAASRHDGLNAGEAGADYVSFGPIGATALGDGNVAAADLFDWWSQVVEVPVVAEGALSLADVRALTPFTDFFAFGREIWAAPDPVDALAALLDAMRL